MKKFVVVYDWGTGATSVREFDTIEEALEDRECYIDATKFPVYQRVPEERICYLSDGRVIRQTVHE